MAQVFYASRMFLSLEKIHAARAHALPMEKLVAVAWPAHSYKQQVAVRTREIWIVLRVCEVEARGYFKLHILGGPSCRLDLGAA